MGKIDTWQREIDRLYDRLSELEGMEITSQDGDITDSHIERIRASIEKHQEMINSYEGDDA